MTAPTIQEDTAFYQALGFSPERATEKAEHLHADMARLNAELRESGSRRERKALSEYVLHPEHFIDTALLKTATLETAIEFHAKACRRARAQIAANDWTADSARCRLASHGRLLLIGRYLRRFGERKRVELMATREAA